MRVGALSKGGGEGRWATSRKQMQGVRAMLAPDGCAQRSVDATPTNRSLPGRQRSWRRPVFGRMRHTRAEAPGAWQPGCHPCRPARWRPRRGSPSCMPGGMIETQCSFHKDQVYGQATSGGSRNTNSLRESLTGTFMSVHIDYQAPAPPPTAACSAGPGRRSPPQRWPLPN